MIIAFLPGAGAKKSASNPGNEKCMRNKFDAVTLPHRCRCAFV